MYRSVWDIALATFAVLLSAAIAPASTDALQQVIRASGSAQIVVAQDDLDPIRMKVNGERIKKDGRLRYVGSIARSEGVDMVRREFACDSNPYNGASIEGIFEVEGPFTGVLAIDVPLDPIIEGRIAVKSSAVVRVASDTPGVLLSLDSGEAVCSILIDQRESVRLGRGPFSIERRTPGVSSPRSWSVGEEEGEEPAFFDFVRDTLSVRVRCKIEEGRRAVYSARVQLVGDPDDFKFRDELEEKVAEDSIIPRRRGSISISVPGAGKGRSRGRSVGRTNKPPAVVRPSKPDPHETGD